MFHTYSQAHCPLNAVSGEYTQNAFVQRAPAALLQSPHAFISPDYRSLHLPEREPGHEVEN